MTDKKSCVLQNECEFGSYKYHLVESILIGVQ